MQAARMGKGQFILQSFKETYDNIYAGAMGLAKRVGGWVCGQAGG